MYTIYCYTVGVGKWCQSTNTKWKPPGSHWRQGPFCVDHKTYAKPSAFVKYMINFLGTGNTLSLWKNMCRTINKTKNLKFIFLAYSIPNLDYVSHTKFNCGGTAKPLKYLNYQKGYVTTAYLTTYLDLWWLLWIH
jgi:hypothetical protein